MGSGVAPTLVPSGNSTHVEGSFHSALSRFIRRPEKLPGRRNKKGVDEQTALKSLTARVN